ncbi:MAG: AAA family ATPase [Prevotellaceae bacterium]|nr:AAA family ATPase [Prevotellaceae bacterium]
MTNPYILKQEFIEYARTCILSRRPSNKENFVIGRSAADSYVSFVEVDKLFSYNPEKWKDINSIFDIDSSERIKEIYLELVSDSEFNRIDSQETSQYFRSNAIKQYYCFLKAREVVLGNTKPIDNASGNTKNIDNLSCQQIFYGAPGTGKSHRINEETEGESVIRTTFHPDSDYSTFVGAYKPTMGLLPICDERGQPMKIGSSVLHKEQIVYEFVDQAFLQAYVNAWKYYAQNSFAAKKQFLVIEEINRGNCAQIFGDLFQLLDRNDNGFSDYPINADKDMKKQLRKAFNGIRIDNAESINQLYHGRDIVNEVLAGDILLLPDNLYIWATMNTSDQSLFPIDSAFKRRWEWQYMPIGKGYNKDGSEIKWAIEGATKKYDWWSFIENINAQIAEATQSEDKKLGFFFCKATDNLISTEKFVGKVIFYLWNDVFKNNGFEGPIFKDVDGTELSFAKFYKSDMKGNAIVQKDKVELFLNNLGVEEFKDGNIPSVEPEEDEDGNQESSPSTGRDYTKFSINGVGNYAKNNLAAECVKKYIELNPTKTAEEVLNDWRSLGNIVPHFIESKEQYDARTDNSKRSHEIACGGAVIYVAHNGYGNNGKVLVLMDAVNQKDWGITIQKNV